MVFKRILGFFKSKKKILASANIASFTIVWWLNNIKSRIGNSAFYFHIFLKMTSILGISAFYHDSAAALLIDG